ncbi:MAG TPA: dihydrolipoyl dehydrogenase [Bacillales bacterium]|nr:dihydrolipoyl dehydrogenase [Bacillales bacterium]
MKTIAIIGGGPAGYVAAITAARHNQQVILIEESNLGGTCLNEGCIPTKSLLESADIYEKVRNAKQFGINLQKGDITINWSGVQHHKSQVVHQLVQGIGYLMRKNKIQVINGKASFLSDHQILINHNGDEEVIGADKVIISTGSEPVSLPFAPVDDKWVIQSKEAMSLPEIPSSLLIVGGGVIGCEFASIYSRMGTKVTIVEMADQIVPGEDPDIASVLHEELEKVGVAIYLSTSLKQLNPETRLAVFEGQDGLREVTTDHVLIAIGRKPHVAELGLDQVKVHFTKQGIQVNDHMQTSIPHIYACGDVVGGRQLAHVAFHEGTVAALHASGIERKVNYQAVPRCIYTAPEIASVGLTETQAREHYEYIRVGEFPFSANGKALINNEPIGKVKVITESEFDEIVGISIVGPHATELIGQGTAILNGELTLDVMEEFISAHPTLSESIQEAARNAVGNAMHV